MQYKYNEDQVLSYLKQYIDNTYNEHYVGNDGIQAIDVWKSLDIDEQAFRSNLIKYSMRYKQKKGQELKDLMKILHYAILLVSRNHINEIEESINDETHYVK